MYNLFEPIEGSENWNHVLVIGFLIWSKASFVYACVEVVLHPSGYAINGSMVLRRV